MGNVQGYGAFKAQDNSNKKSKDEQKKELSQLEKALEEKKLELYKLLDIYKYHINVAILEHSFKLKNEELVENITSELKNQDEKIKKMKKNIVRKCETINILQILYKEKNINLILFCKAVLVILGLISTTMGNIIHLNHFLLHYRYLSQMNFHFLLYFQQI